MFYFLHLFFKNAENQDTMVSPIKMLKQRVFETLKAVLMAEPPKDGAADLKGKKILILSTEPGEEVVHSGGTARLIHEGGGQADIFFYCREEGTAEKYSVSDAYGGMLEAASVLGVNRVTFLDSLSASATPLQGCTEELSTVIEDADYDFIFCPCPTDSHTVHMKLFRILLDANHRLKKKRPVWLYHTDSLGMANRVVNVEKVLFHKLRAIEVFKKEDLLKGIKQDNVSVENFLSLEGTILAAVSELFRHHLNALSLSEPSPSEVELVGRAFPV